MRRRHRMPCRAWTIDDIAVERPQNAEHGDFATSLPLKLARPMRMNPMQIAERIAENLSNGSEGADLLQSAAVARPGFINFTLKHSWLQGQVEAVQGKWRRVRKYRRRRRPEESRLSS